MRLKDGWRKQIKCSVLWMRKKTIKGRSQKHQTLCPLDSVLMLKLNPQPAIVRSDNKRSQGSQSKGNSSTLTAPNYIWQEEVEIRESHMREAGCANWSAGFAKEKSYSLSPRSEKNNGAQVARRRCTVWIWFIVEHIINTVLCTCGMESNTIARLWASNKKMFVFSS